MRTYDEKPGKHDPVAPPKPANPNLSKINRGSDENAVLQFQHKIGDYSFAKTLPSDPAQNTFEGIAQADQATLLSDVESTRNLSLKCQNTLIPRVSGQLDAWTQKLLEYAFDIPRYNYDQILVIRNVYLDLPGLVSQSAFADASLAVNPATNQPLAQPPVGEDMFTVSTLPFKIFVKPAYFGLAPDSRANLLLHEGVHLRFPGAGHPPNNQRFSYPNPTDMNVPYQDAVRNPYCYDHFAYWITH